MNRGHRCLSFYTWVCQTTNRVLKKITQCFKVKYFSSLEKWMEVDVTTSSIPPELCPLRSPSSGVAASSCLGLPQHVFSYLHIKQNFYRQKWLMSVLLRPSPPCFWVKVRAPQGWVPPKNHNKIMSLTTGSRTYSMKKPLTMPGGLQAKSCPPKCPFSFGML